MRCYDRLRRDAQGATAIEFAFVAGILALMLLGIFDYGRAFWYRMEVQNAAQAGADWAQYNAFSCGTSAATCNASGVPASLQNAVINATSLCCTSSQPPLTDAGIIVYASGHNGETCGCPTASGLATNSSTGSQSWPSVAQACGTACTNGGNATGFAMVTVNFAFTPLFPWPALGSPTTLSGSATAICYGGQTC